jgi:RNA polymerase sigma-70 factor (ECF subfamily)
MGPSGAEVPEFSSIYREHRAAVLSHLCARVRRSDAEDLTQEVFRKAERGLGTFRGESSLRTWLLRIATRTMLDHVRSRRVREENRTDALPPPEQAGHPLAVTPDALIAKADAPIRVDRQEMHACIREYVDQLPPSYREVILLRELHGLSNEEVARHLGIGIDAAKIRLHRAREALRRLLNDGCEFYATESHGLGCDRRSPATVRLTARCSCESKQEESL